MPEPAPPLEEVYDAGTVERLEAFARREAERVAGAPLPVRRRAAAGVMVAAIGLGLQQVLEARNPAPVIEEVDADGLDVGLRVRLRWTGDPRTTVALYRT